MAFWFLGFILATLVLLGFGWFLVVDVCKPRLVFGGKRLPPGTMGWPYVGETLQLYSQDPNVFFSSKHKRYGDIFKTHILGCRCVMVANPEAVKFILVKKAHLFKPTFPASKETLLGRNALFFHEGKYHARIRKLVQSAFRPEVICSNVSGIERIAVRILSSWDGRQIVTIQEMRKYAFEVGILAVFGHLEAKYKTDLIKYYHILKKGYNSLPINLPGTSFNKSLKARKKLREIFKQIIEERKGKQEVENSDLLKTLMTSVDDEGTPLSEEHIVDNIIGVLFAAHDTTATALTWLIKYLTDHPSLLDAVKAEQEAIKRSHGEGQTLTWVDARSMILTAKVIQETLRMASIISFTFREAVEDVEYKGYVIPKGWKVMPLFRIIHHTPDFFQDPHKFDPARFEEPPKANSFMPFGSGVHSCPGNELAKVEMLVLIHHLTTNYRWEVAASESGVEYGPFPLPRQGLPLKISRR